MISVVKKVRARWLGQVAVALGGKTCSLRGVRLPRYFHAVLLAALGVCVRAPALTLEEVVADPKLWPAEVTVNATTKATVLKNGQPAGMMLVGAGRKLAVSGLAADGVTAKLGGATVRIPLDKTDVLQRLEAAGVPVEAAAAEPEAEAAAPVADTSAAPTTMQRRLAGKLVQLTGNTVGPANDARLAGVKYYGLYYSASWCGPCRQFTPGFIDAYRRIRQKHPEFEVIFLSADRSAGDMRDYMKGDKMPWPALKYELREGNPELMRYSGPGIPCLVLVDAAGRVLADSFNGDNYVGPGHVLNETIRILDRGR